MPPQILLKFLAASMLLALTPGPDILTVITRSITQGTRAGIVASLGFASGLTVHTTLAALGIAAIIAAWPAALWTLRCLGAAYLLFLAVRNLLSKSAFTLESSSDRRGLFAIFTQSVLMNVLNPKVIFFFLAFLPGFIVPPSGNNPVWLQMIFLGALFALSTIVVFGTCALFAGAISTWLRRTPQAATPLRYATSALFLVIASCILIG